MAYGYYRSVTTDHTQCGSSDSNNFTILVNITNNDFKLVSNGGLIHNTGLSNGQVVCLDVAFYSGIGPTGLLNFEIEFYDGVVGQVIARVKIPLLSHTIDEVIYCYYSDASVNSFQGNVPATWDSFYLGVWHFPNGTTLALRDSTGNGNNGTNHNAVSAGVGNPDGAATFVAASSQYISVTSEFGEVTALTVSFWTFGPATSNPINGVISKGVSGFSDFVITQQQNILTGSPVLFYMQNSIGGNTGNVSTNADVWTLTQAWHRFTLTWDGTTVRTYVNGVADVTASLIGTLNNSDPIIAFGAYSSGNNFFDGTLDEINFSSIARSADWDLASYNNQKPSSTFITLGAQVIVPPTPPVDIMAYTQALQLGLETTILQNIVYALPARSCFVQSGAAVEVSNTTGGGFSTLTNANTVGAQTAAQFIRCTTADTTISVKSL